MKNSTVSTIAAQKTLDADQMIIDASKIPGLVDEQIKKLKALDEKVQDVLANAKDAKDSADQTRSCKKSGILGIARADALETISDAVKALGDANESNAQGLSEVFGFMQSLAEISKGLFGLASMSMVAHNTVVQQLELKMRGASGEELSELAQNELERTISILKNQGNVLAEQDKQKNRLEAMQLRLNALSNEGERHDAEQDVRLDEGERKVAEHDNRLDAGEQKDAEHDRRLDEGDQHDVEQDKLLKQHSQTDQEHAQMIAANIEHDAQQDEQIAENMEQDARQDQQLAQHAEKDAEHDRLIAELREENQALRANINDLRSLVEKKAGKELSNASIAISIIALILAGIQFFL